MAFPATPNTLISRLKYPDRERLWQESWKTFFSLYDQAIQTSVLTAFRACNWHQVSDDLLHETVAEVVISFCRNQEKTGFDPSKGRLRSHLSQLARWRVRDQIAKHNKRPNEIPVEKFDNDGEPLEGSVVDDQVHANWRESCTQEENEAFDQALLKTILEDARTQVSPRNWLIFDQIKTERCPPEEVMAEFNMTRSAVDNAVFKVMAKLRELANSDDYKREVLL